VGQSKFVWQLREHKTLLNVFATLWSCDVDDLLVSMDGINFGLPTKLDQLRWPHLDQTVSSESPMFYQGCLSLTTTTGGLNFYSTSHKWHRQFVTDRAAAVGAKPGFYQLTDEDRDWYYGKPAVPMEVPSVAGELTVWDSRTVHWGRRPIREWQTPQDDPARICVYVCYIPRQHIFRDLTEDKKKLQNKLEKHLQKRIKTFEERRMTTHQPYPVKLFPKGFRTYGDDSLIEKFKDQPTIQDNELTPTMRRLIGYN
jgi:hypothetical protein